MIELLLVLLIFCLSGAAFILGSKLIIRLLHLKLIGIPIIIYSAFVFIIMTYAVFYILKVVK